jgi:hypothetical protein
VLGSKFRKNSGRNFGSGPFSGILGPEAPESKFQDSLFSGVLQSDVFSKGLFYMTPPPASLGLSERAYQLFFSLRDSRSRRYQESWTWSTSIWTKISGVFCRNFELCRNTFRSPVDVGPWTGRNVSGILNLESVKIIFKPRDWNHSDYIHLFC